MRRIEDLADSPLVPALLEKVHLESDPAMLTVSAPFKSSFLCRLGLTLIIMNAARHH